MRLVRRALIGACGTWLLATVGLLAAATAGAQTLYWVESNFYSPLARSANPDGSGAQALPLIPSTLPEGVAFDEIHRKVYWVESVFYSARILRASPDYSNVETLVSDGSTFRGIALDVPAGKMYWTSSNLIDGSKIRRANLDGSNVEVVMDFGAGSSSNLRGIALDTGAGKMYWADFGLGVVRRANLDGSGQEDMITLSGAWGVAVDPAGGYLYYANYTQGNIARRPIDGGTLTKLKVGLANPTYLALDPVGGMIYWIEAGASGQKLRRSAAAVGGVIEDLPVTIATYGGLVFSPQSIVDVPAGEPVTAFALGPVLPNPGRGLARVEYTLPHPARVRITALDVQGRQIAIVVDEERPAGRHQATWTGRTETGHATPGIYFLRLESSGVYFTRRFVLLN